MTADCIETIENELKTVLTKYACSYSGAREILTKLIDDMAVESKFILDNTPIHEISPFANRSIEKR